MKNRLIGIAVTAALSLLFVLILFWEIVKSPNTTFFAVEGDGLKAYCTALYHVNHDSLASRTMFMNYPYGEIITFTDSQPLVVNSIRIISSLFGDISTYTVGIINLLMLFSLVLGAVFINMLFAESGVKWWYSAPVAVGIALLSPQVARMAGHFSLSWVFWLPLMLWLVIRFDKSRWLIYTLLIGAATFMAGYMHPYFTALFGFILLGYWFFRFFWYRKAGTFWYRDLHHILLQFVLPLFILQSLALLSNDVVDRTQWPFGFWGNLAHPVAIFFPAGNLYPVVPKVLTVFRHISWESWTYIGTPAALGFFAGFVFLIRRIIRKEPFHRMAEVSIVSILFWVSLIALLYSFGLPFIAGMKGAIAHLGILKQLRVLARFSWIFYYMVNLIVFVALYYKAFTGEAKLLWKILAISAAVLVIVEGTINTSGVSKKIRHELPELVENDNLTSENQWVSSINKDEYQAIIPMPYFHVGSENIWISGTNAVVKATFAAALKTGLPTTGVMLSRTSISQTYLNYTLHTDPMERLEFSDFLPDERPFLVLVMKDYFPKPSEKLLLSAATPVTDAADFMLYNLPVSDIRRFNLAYRDSLVSSYRDASLIRRGSWFVNDASKFAEVIFFDGESADKSINGTGALEFVSGKEQVVWQYDNVARPLPENLLISFWVHDYRRDAYMRTCLDATVTTENGEHKLQPLDFFKNIAGFRGDRALVEFELNLPEGATSLKLSLLNNVLPKETLAIGQLMVREPELYIYWIDGRWLWMNNRCVLARQQ